MQYITANIGPEQEEKLTSSTLTTQRTAKVAGDWAGGGGHSGLSAVQLTAAQSSPTSQFAGPDLCLYIFDNGLFLITKQVIMLWPTFWWVWRGCQ